METKLIEELIKIKNSKKPAVVHIFNDGRVEVKDSDALEDLNNLNTKRYAGYIIENLRRAAELYVYHCDYDKLKMFIDMGLVYYKKDVDDNNHVKGLPINNVVYYKVTDIESYLDNEQTNKYNYCEKNWGSSGYINYNELFSIFEKEGLKFNGPDNFKELRDSILCGEKIDVTLEADLREKDAPKQLIRK